MAGESWALTGASGSWSVKSNWSDDAVPTTDDTVYIGDGDQTPAYTVTLTGSLPALANLSIDNYGALATLDISGQAGFGAPGVVNFTVDLGDEAEVEFGGGQISEIAASGSLRLGSATTFIADSTGLGSNSALKGLQKVNGLLQLDDGASLATDGDLADDDEIDVAAGNYGNSTAGATLTVGGALTVGDNKFLEIGFGSDNPSATASTVKATSLDNSGSITMDGAAPAVLDVGSTAGTGTAGVLTGDFYLSQNSLVEFAKGEINEISGVLELFGAHSLVADADDLTANSALTGLKTISGSLELYGGASVSTSGSVVNSGSIQVDGSVLSIAGAAGLASTGVLGGAVSLADDGLIEFGSGYITQIAAKASLEIDDGTSFIAHTGAITSNSALLQLASIATGGSLELADDAAVTTNVNLDNEGTIGLDAQLSGAGASLTVNGALTNNGSIEIGGQYGGETSQDIVQANSLAGSGSISLAGAAGALSVLDIKSAAGFGAQGALHGSVTIGDDSLFEFASGSITDIADDGALTLNSTSGFLADANATTKNSALTGLASIEGFLSLSKGVTITTGALDNSAGYDGQTFSGGVILDQAAMTVNGALTNTGNVMLFYQATLTVNGTLSNSGVAASFNLEVGIEVDNGSTLTTSALDNTGEIEIDGSAGAALLDVKSVAGAGQKGVWTGSVSIYGQGVLEFASGGLSSVAASGLLKLDGASAFVADADDTAKNGALTGLASVAGEFDLEDGASLSVSGDFDNSGYVGVDDNDGGPSGSSANGALDVAGVLTNSGVSTADDDGGVYIGSDLGFYSAETSTIQAKALVNTGEIYVSGGPTNKAFLTISGSASNGGAGELDVGDDATVSIGGALTGDGVVDVFGGGLLKLGDGATGGQIVFYSGGGAVEVDGGTLGDSVASFGADDAIDLATLTYKSSYEVVWRPATGLLKIIDTANANATVATLNIESTSQASLITLAKFGAGGTSLTATALPLATVGAGDVIVSNLTGEPFLAYESLFSFGAPIGTEYFYNAASGQPFSSYAYEYSKGGDFIGSAFLYTNVTGEAYTGEETAYNGSGQLTSLLLTGVDDAAYSSYEFDYVGGVFAGSQFYYTDVPYGAPYSSYEVDYGWNSAFAGDKFFYTDVTGQPYTGEEEDFDASGDLARVILTGVTGQSYYQIEEDYDAGIYAGFKAYYVLTGQSYTNEELDVSASSQIEKVVYSGITGSPFSSIAETFAGGSVSTVTYGYTDVTGEPYYAYQVTESSSGVALQETFDFASGSHTLLAFASGQTLTSLGEDKMTGSGATTFVLDAIYGADLITNFSSSDTVVLSAPEYAQLNQAIARGNYSGGNAKLTFSDGDSLTFKGMSESQLTALVSHFT